MASAQRGLAAKLKRRFTPEEMDGLRTDAVARQGGRCACCGEEPRTAPLNLDWALSEVNDDGLPLYRDALCRPCKIAVGRVVHPSRYVLAPKVLERVEAYLKRPWHDPEQTLRRLGLRRNFGAEMVTRQVTEAEQRTDETVAFLASIGAPLAPL